MPKTKKKFIDRKKAVTFNLVHRSQRDPLIADESAPQRVLVPVNANVPPSKEAEPKLTTEQRREEQQKYGIFFDDDYNYLQHLKDTKEVIMLLQPKQEHKGRGKPQPGPSGETPKAISETLQLPSSVFASEFEEEVGLLNKAAPQGLCLDLDPDVVAALDEDYDHENPDNELEDNFIELAMDEGDGEGGWGDEDGSDMSDSMSDDGSDGGSDRAFASDTESGDSGHSQGPFAGLGGRAGRGGDDTRSRFSQYSMSSSVVRRNQGLTLLDDRFERMFAEYDDTALGALDCEQIEGHLPDGDEQLLAAAAEFEESRRRRVLERERERSRLHRLQEESEDSDTVTVDATPAPRWDCVSVLSTHSNLYNRPKVIEEPQKPKKIKINARTGLPADELGAPRLTARALARLDASLARAGGGSGGSGSDEEGTRAETVLSTLSALSIRPKEETQEEKKERKRILKEYRKERRIEKKANQEAFKEEKKRQIKIALNNRNNIQGVKIV